MIIYNWSIKCDQVKPPCSIGMLQVSWVQETIDSINADFCFIISESRRFFRNLKQKYITLLVGSCSIVRPMKTIHDNITTKFASETFFIFFSYLRLLIANKLFKPDDWRFKFNFFAIFVFYSLTGVDQEHYNRFSCHHVLFDVWVVG